MDYLFFYKFFISLIILIDIIGAWLAFLVYRSNPKGKINRLFVLMIIFMFFWVTFAASARVIAAYGFSLKYSLFVLKIAWFVTPLLFLALYRFSILVIKEEKKYVLLTGIAFLLGTLSAFAVFTNLILADIKFSGDVLSFIYGKGIIPFLVAIFFMVCATLYPLFKKYAKLAGEEKKRMQFFLIGVFIFYLSNIIFNIFLPMVLDISRYYYIGDYSSIFLLGFLAYSIGKYEFLGVKVILTELLVTVITVMGIILILKPFFVDPLWLKILLGFVFLLFCVFGYLLIQGVLREVKQKKYWKTKLKKEQKNSRGLTKTSKKEKKSWRSFTN